jgi:hypothetical protein
MKKRVGFHAYSLAEIARVPDKVPRAPVPDSTYTQEDRAHLERLLVGLHQRMQERGRQMTWARLYDALGDGRWRDVSAIPSVADDGLWAASEGVR